jgi:molybdate transport system substrate-binding protein
LRPASLTESFTEIGKQFEAANPGTKVTFSFGASSALAEQNQRWCARRRIRVGEPEEHGPGR